MNKSILFLSASLLFAFGAVPANAQTPPPSFDTSGTASLTGAYNFRYAIWGNDSSGDIVESCSLTGSIIFDGKGTYTLSGTQLYDSAGTTDSSGSCSSLGGGTYGVQANGLAQFDNPMFTATLYGTFSKPVITASSTEDGLYDMFIAVQAPTTPFSTSNLNGSFTVGSMEILSSSQYYNALTHQAYFTLAADGAGNISPITLTGSAYNLVTSKASSYIITQKVSGANYSLSGTNSGSLTIPNSNNSQLISGTKILYVSADGNYILGGNASGSDIIFGFRQSSSTPANSSISGTYFVNGMDADLSGDCQEASYCLDNFYGSVNANGAGTLIWHQRLQDPVGAQLGYSPFSEDYTSAAAVVIGSTGCGVPGCYYDGTSGNTTLVGNGGKAIMLLGSGPYFSFYLGIQAPAYTATSSVWINPIGITNAANFTGITNAYAPGELVNIYGTFTGASTQTDTAIPITTNLGGVQVLVNGFSAPIYYASPTQISALIPYELASDPNNNNQFDNFATFQVIVNGSKSNTVTLYADQSSPGLYALSQNGIGAGAILHANYTQVSSSSPATPGETVSLFMNGLGTVTPALADGAPGPSGPLSYSSEFNNSDLILGLIDGVDNEASANITYAGAAPGFAGLYQVNFTVPKTGLGNGQVYLDFYTLEGESILATIYLSGFGHSSGITSVPSVRRSALRQPAKAPSSTAAVKRTVRRALPARNPQRL